MEKDVRVVYQIDLSKEEVEILDMAMDHFEGGYCGDNEEALRSLILKVRKAFRESL
jgi:hypothetical protein